jgi:hypothetical protein
MRSLLSSAGKVPGGPLGAGAGCVVKLIMNPESARASAVVAKERGKVGAYLDSS